MVAEEANKQVTSVRCSFCAFFGRTKVKAGHEHTGEKRQRSSPNDTNLHRHFKFASNLLTFRVSVPILSAIISDLFFRLDEVLADFDDDGDEEDGGAAATIAKYVAAKAKQKMLALKLFVKDKANVDDYLVTIKVTMLYELIMDHVLVGMSFRQVASAMQHTKERCGLSKLGG
uniref:Uncharacterized protein n=1 Tax=Peronospora matthiolae TaxID=2874970 RepID=A0AAV1TLT7_9STRA